jgi:hypothetical protein
MTDPQTPWRQFLHWCHKCQIVLLPYGNTCPECGTTTPLPVSRMPGHCKPWHQLATTTVLRIGKAYIAVDYDITRDKQVSIKAIRAKGKPSLRIRPYCQKMIIHQIAKAEGIL